MSCSFCGHAPHPGPCPRRINDPQRKGGPPPSDCPCIKREEAS